MPLLERYDVVQWVDGFGNTVEVAFGDGELVFSIVQKCVNYEVVLRLVEFYRIGEQRIEVKAWAPTKCCKWVYVEYSFTAHLNDREMVRADTIWESMLRIANTILTKGPCYSFLR